MHPVIASINFPPIDPVLLRVGPIALRWYGLAYLVGFWLAYVLMSRLARRGSLRVPPLALADVVGWLAVAALIGGRLGWWLVYHRRTGDEPWYEPLAIWHGGMSFHGGLVGVVVALALLCWRRELPFWNLADALAVVAPVGLFFGRIANFINAELPGRPTDLPWGVVFPGESLARHPSQIYEAMLEGPLLLLVLLLWRWRRRETADGATAAMFLIAYGALRFCVEFTRQPDEQIGFVAFGWLTMGQFLSILLCATGILVLYGRWVNNLYGRDGTPSFSS